MCRARKQYADACLPASHFLPEQKFFADLTPFQKLLRFISQAGVSA
ncbi:hypothetical protein CPter91_3306 [Collimonas pratensis]|uniref:Uncharacterized protein n=1 Tax=Collimonas pratensis TaxID=279113 RepID=A0A127Q6H7_9BURK|nr:hypothetical protein CPter91_3306 [Collimonas pratensis]